MAYISEQLTSVASSSVWKLVGQFVV